MTLEWVSFKHIERMVLVWLIVQSGMWACTSKQTQTAVLPSTKPAIAENARSYVEGLNQKVQYTPRPGDLSPEGFNWVHRSFALIYSSCIMAHHLESEISVDCLKNKAGELLAYWQSVRSIGEDQWKKWPQQHRLPFLINAYHAMVLMRKAGISFNAEFWKSTMNPEQFRDMRIFQYEPWDSRIVFLTYCERPGCPALQNRVVNAANFENSLNASVSWFVNHKDRVEWNDSKGTVSVSSYLKPLTKRIVKEEEKFGEWLSQYRRPELISGSMPRSSLSFKLFKTIWK